MNTLIKISSAAFAFASVCILGVTVTSCSIEQEEYEKSFSSSLFKEGDNGVACYRIPALVQANDSSIIAFAEARHDGVDDLGDIDIVARRSTDGGHTWGETIVVWDDENGDACQNPCPVVDRETGRILLLGTWNKKTDSEEAIHARESDDTRRVFILYSDDNGLTWSEPREITSSVKLDEWTWYATGPCHAIQLRSEAHRGRIVVPCNHGEYGNWTVSHVIYSDDGGETWNIGGSAGSGNECTVAELSNGDIMLNMRGQESDNGLRKVAVSHDGGLTFDEPYYDETLEEPMCQASLVNYSRVGALTDTLLFSNPARKDKRKSLTIKRSNDGGKTWTWDFSSKVTMVGNYAGYSDLLVLPEGDVAILYETGVFKNYDEINFEHKSRGCFVDLEGWDRALLYLLYGLAIVIGLLLLRVILWCLKMVWLLIKLIWYLLEFILIIIFSPVINAFHSIRCSLSPDYKERFEQNSKMYAEEQEARRQNAWDNVKDASHPEIPKLKFRMPKKGEDGVE